MPTRQLRSEHAEIIRLSHQLRMHLYPGEPLRHDELLLCRDRFYKLLTVHLGHEDDLLYPRLMRDSNPRIAAIAERFVQELGGLRDDVELWMAIWTQDAIMRGWDAFRAETEELLDTLSNRIVRENRQLYPLLERSRHEERPLVEEAAAPCDPAQPARVAALLTPMLCR